ncbi:MAG: cell division protein FtsX, partial [Prevotella sp.]
MGKKRKTARSRTGLQVVTLCISTTLVLVLLGMMVFSVLTARNLSSYVKENLTVTIMLGDKVTDNQARL